MNNGLALKIGSLSVLIHNNLNHFKLGPDKKFNIAGQGSKCNLIKDITNCCLQYKKIEWVTTLQFFL